MKKEILEIVNDIKLKKQEVYDLANGNKIEEAKKAKKELIELQNKFELLCDLDAESAEKNSEIENGIQDSIHPISNNINEGDNFINALKSKFTGRNVPKDIENILKTSEEEGILIPQDISTTIQELRRQTLSLETFVNVEKATKIEGSRVIEKNADSVPFDNVDEEAIFPEISKPEFVKITYKLRKLGGILKLTKEFYQATDTSFKPYLTKWITKKGIATRNALILKTIDDKKENSIVEISSIDDIKDIINVKLDPAIALGSKIITNQDGYQWLDTLKDANGRYLLQPDITKSSDGMLLGKYPVIKFSNKVIQSTDKIPFYIGNLKEFITLFDLEKLFIEISSEAGSLWEHDLTGIKVRERLDVQVIDEDALIKAELNLGSIITYTLDNENAVSTKSKAKES